MGGVEFMCCADSKIVRCSHATNGETSAVAGVKPVERELQPFSMPETVLPLPQYVLARNISKKKEKKEKNGPCAEGSNFARLGTQAENEQAHWK